MITALDVRGVVEAAVRAPSSHNTQPWSFHVHGDIVELLADRTRGMTVTDPHGRELMMSCGAALLNLRVAAGAQGLRADVLCGPHSDLVARVRLVPAHEAVDDELAEAIPRRHTHRGAFVRRPLSLGVPRAMASSVRTEGALLAMVEPGPVRESVADLVAEADRRQFADPRWRQEVAGWLRPSHTGEGLPAHPVLGAVQRSLLTRLDLGRSAGARDGDLVRTAPAVAVLWTDGDKPVDWLAAGQALERGLLTAAEHGVLAAYANQVCQVEDLRSQLARVLRIAGHPQIVMRLGYPLPRQIQDRHHIRRAQSAYGIT